MGEQCDDQRDEQRAKDICLRQLTVRARSRAELARTLARREILDAVADRVLDRLSALGLIDDTEFAAAFIRTAQRDRGLGRAALRHELRRRGVDGTIVEDALNAIDVDVERDRAARLVAKRLDAAVFAGTTAARRRLLGMLARRGYPAALSVEVVNDALRGFAEPLDQAAVADPFD